MFFIKNYFFKKKLKVEIPKEPYRELSDVWTGNEEKGRDILKNKNPTSKIDNINTFLFLRDLKSCGTIETRSLSRKIVEQWINQNQNFFSTSYKQEYISNRIVIICFTYSWFAKSGKKDFQYKLLRSLTQQIKIQELNLKKINSEKCLIKILKSLIIGNVFLYNQIDKINFYLKSIEQSAKKLTLLDGGHVSRCPIEQLDLLRDLIEIRAAIAPISSVKSKILHKQVKLMSSYFKTFCMPNNECSFFNGGALINKFKIIETLKRIGNGFKNFEMLKHSGYIRLNNKHVNIMLDLGKKDILQDASITNKASIGSFELYYKHNKLITNLGDLPKNSSKISISSLASTAAHSTLSIDERNNIDLYGNRKLDYLEIKTNHNNLGDLVELQHDGYKKNFGVNHRRTIFLSQNGLDLRGEDEIININNTGITPKQAVIRFHLCQDIELFPLRNGKILLTHKDGFIFHFIASEDDLEIKETRIFKNNFYENSKQIIINVSLIDIRQIKTKVCHWSFKFDN